MSDRDNITLPREVVEKAIKAFENGCPSTCENGMIDSGGFHPWGQPALVPCPACLAFEHLRTALAAEQPSEDVEALRRDAYQGGWLREWLDSNGLLARAIRGESLAGYEHPDIKALRRDAERLREALAWAYNLRHLRGHSDPVVIPERFAPLIEDALRR